MLPKQLLSYLNSKTSLSFAQIISKGKWGITPSSHTQVQGTWAFTFK